MRHENAPHSHSVETSNSKKWYNITIMTNDYVGLKQGRRQSPGKNGRREQVQEIADEQHVMIHCDGCHD
jgi:hypothetical protein